MNISIGQAAEVIGVSISTLRRWEEEELYKPDFRTKGGHRRYDLSRIECEFLNKSSSEDKRKVVAYARVSSHDQKADLIRQEQRLERVCAEDKYNFELISEIALPQARKDYALCAMHEIASLQARKDYALCAMHEIASPQARKDYALFAMHEIPSPQARKDCGGSFSIHHKKSEPKTSLCEEA